MHPWQAVFDNDEVHWRTRMQAANLIALAATVASLTLVAIVLGIIGIVPLVLLGGVLAGAWAGVALWTWRRLLRLRRVAWCLKLSEAQIVGYDYARRRTLLAWEAIQRVEIADGTLVLVGQDLCRLEIPALFRNFADLSHRIVAGAEAHQVPVYLHGQPWQSLDVYVLYPFLSETLSVASRSDTRS